jgi:hypothetical protein
MGGEAWLIERVQQAMSAPELRVKRTIEGIGKWVDVREYLRRVQVGDEAAIAATAEAGLVGSLVVIAVDLEIRGSGAVKVSEVAEVLTSADVPHRAVRFAMGTWRDGAVVSPFDRSESEARTPPASTAAPAPTSLDAV